MQYGSSDSNIFSGVYICMLHHTHDEYEFIFYSNSNVVIRIYNVILEHKIIVGGQNYD